MEPVITPSAARSNFWFFVEISRILEAMSVAIAEEIVEENKEVGPAGATP